jgi:putative DNA primase/helicase
MGGRILKDGRPTSSSRPSLMTRAIKLQQEVSGEGQVDPFKLAREFVDAVCRNPLDQREITLRYWRAEWYRWDYMARYELVDAKTMAVDVTGFIKSYIDENDVVDQWGRKIRVSQSLVSNTLNALTALVAVDPGRDMPMWLGEDGRGPFISLENGLLDISDVANGKVQLRGASALWFSTVAFPFSYDRRAKCDRWLAFLDEVLEGDVERIALLQEWVGYLLTPDTSQHKFVIAEGEGANGKSVFLDVVTALVGPENVSHVPLEMFGVRFQLTATLGKLANICAEVGEMDRVAEGFFKAFTAGDRMYFDRKCIPGVQAYPTARVTLSTNERPRFRDRSGGVWRRTIIIPFRVTIPPDRQDRQLTERLKAELPGIFNWSLKGLRRLRRNGRFTEPRVCQEALEAYRNECNPAKQFLGESCREDAAGSIACQSLFDEYSAWSEDNGFETLDARQFGKEVRRTFPNVKREKAKAHRFIGRKWVYRGVSHVSH